jgi:cobalt/nickel transport system permease protein
MIHRRHPGEVLLASLAWLALSLALPPLPWAPAQLAATSAVALAQLRIPSRRWFVALGAPGAFSLLAVLPLAWNASFDLSDMRVWAPPLRSFTASSAVLLLGLSTPMAELLYVGRRLRIPLPWIDLAFLLHRFACAAVDVSAAMTRAMAFRAPRATWRRRVRAAAWLSSSLFQRILARARRSEHGLAARGVNAWVVPPAPAGAFSFSGTLLSLCGPAAIALAALLHARWQ